MFNKRAEELSLREFSRRVYLLVRGGREAQAQVELAKYCAAAARLEGSEYADEVRREIDAMYAYLHEDEAGFAKLVEQDWPESFEAAVARRDVAAALERAGVIELQQGWRMFVTAALLAASEGDAGAARRALERAAALLAEGSREERQIGQWLSGVRPELEDVLELRLWVADKRLVLALVGQIHPEVREGTHELARRLNYDKRPPHLLLRRVVGE
jgi:hypothetical protein